jgi:hypothetical protein
VFHLLLSFRFLKAPTSRRFCRVYFAVVCQAYFPNVTALQNENDRTPLKMPNFVGFKCFTYLFHCCCAIFRSEQGSSFRSVCVCRLSFLKLITRHFGRLSFLKLITRHFGRHFFLHGVLAFSINNCF